MSYNNSNTQNASRNGNKRNDDNCKCNYRSKPNCRLNGITQCQVCKALSTTSSNSFVYYGTPEGEFKTWYNNHTKLFRHCECMNETELSKHVWNLKDRGIDNNLSCSLRNLPRHLAIAVAFAEGNLHFL